MASLTFVVLAVLFVLTVGQRISPHSILNCLVLVHPARQASTRAYIIYHVDSSAALDPMDLSPGWNDVFLRAKWASN